MNTKDKMTRKAVRVYGSPEGTLIKIKRFVRSRSRSRKEFRSENGTNTCFDVEISKRIQSRDRTKFISYKHVAS